MNREGYNNVTKTRGKSRRQLRRSERELEEGTIEEETKGM